MGVLRLSKSKHEFLPFIKIPEKLSPEQAKQVADITDLMAPYRSAADEIKGRKVSVAEDKF